MQNMQGTIIIREVRGIKEMIITIMKFHFKLYYITCNSLNISSLITGFLLNKQTLVFFFCAKIIAGNRFLLKS